MKHIAFVRMGMTVFMVTALALGAGCRGRQVLNEDGPIGDEEDIFDPRNMDGTYSLAPRGDFGQEITDVQFDNVQFSYDSFQIPPVERRKIEAVADYLLANPNTTVLVDGHCDERGSREYNLSLGEHRALSIRAVLISLGVAGDRIHTRSFGSEQPLDMGSSEASWAINRRGEFTLFRP